MAISKRTRVILIVAAALVLAAVLGVNLTRERRNRVAVQTEKAGRADIVSVVTASGEIKPQRYVNVSANVSGRITHLGVKEGDRVRTGQVLARIDSSRFEAGERQSEAALEAARADLTRAQADLEQSRLDLARSESMHAERLISDQAIDQVRAEVKMKLAVVESQRKRIAQQAAMLETNRDDLIKTTVPAPMDGVVTSLQKEEGEVVIGAQSFQPTVIMTIGDLSVMEVEVLVDETDIRNVAVGQEATVRVDALGDIQVKGTVRKIGSSAIPRGQAAAAAGSAGGSQAKDFKVTITLLDPPASLRSGLNATADVVTARRPGVLAVPIQSVVVRQVNKEGKVVDPSTVQAAEDEPQPIVKKSAASRDEEKEGVFVVDKGKAAFRPVKTGTMGETQIEILEGLKEGEEVVTGSYKTLRTLKDEARVKLEKEKKERR
ncbi:MAG TPA: efflux RND transporter periplasmic adaptor subunit [Vicinamibacteria bacterium]|jgi:HlyD family secretion protein